MDTTTHTDSGEPGTPTPRLDMIGMVTRDMAAALAFYRRLGLHLPEGVEGEAHVEAVGPGGVRIAWDTAELVESIHPGEELPTGPGRISLAFLCQGPAEVDRLYQELTAAGHPGEKEPWDAFWGQRYAIVRDPDGNTIDLFAKLP